MSKWILIKIMENGEKVALPTEYNTYDDACTAQETAEITDTENGYLIYTNDEWMYEVESGNVLPS